jgi:hypothetical protein
LCTAGLACRVGEGAIEEAYVRADATLAARAPAPRRRTRSSRATSSCSRRSSRRRRPPLATIQAGDGVVHFNYRQDRAIQLTRAFVEDDFTGFARGPSLDVCYRGLTRYYDEFPNAVLPPMNMDELVGEIVSKRASGSCASPSTRSTGTSRASSTASASRRIPARTACSSRA